MTDMPRCPCGVPCRRRAGGRLRCRSPRRHRLGRRPVGHREPGERPTRRSRSSCTPGPPIDASKAKGKTIFIIPESSSIPFINTIDDSIVRVAKLLGIKTTDLHEPGAAVAVGGGHEPGRRPEARPDHAPGRARPARAPAAADRGEEGGHPGARDALLRGVRPDAAERHRARPRAVQPGGAARGRLDDRRLGRQGERRRRHLERGADREGDARTR